MKQLEGRIALVAGAARGAGRGIAEMLGEAGATVLCTGRSSRDGAGPSGRPETIEETAERVNARGGVGIAVRVDHADDDQLAALFARVRAEHGRLDLLVNVLGGKTPVTQWGSFWTHPLETGRAMVDEWVWPHLLTMRHAAALMAEQRSGLIVQITEGDFLCYRANLFYDLARIAGIRLVYGAAEELAGRGVAVVALAPGYLRTEAMLDHFGVTEATWREAGAQDPNFLHSESPCFVGRAVAALAADPGVAAKSGGLFSSWALAAEYGFDDVDGSRPDWGRHFADTFGGEVPGGPPKTGMEWRIVRRGG